MSIYTLLVRLFSVKLIFTLVFVLITNLVFAQDNYPCELTASKKIIKQYEEARAERNPTERREMLKKIIAAYPEFYPALYDYSESNIRLAERSGKGDFGFAAKYLKKVIEVCPQYHPYPYYYLGMLAYGSKNYKDALKYFEGFSNFRYEDDRKYPKDYEEKNAEVEKMLPKARSLNDILSNPVPFDPKVVEGISSPADEYLAIISPDEELAFYIRKYEKKGKNELVPRLVEEFTSSNQKNGKFDEGAALPPPFNLTDNAGGPTITIDNKILYFTICRTDKEGYPNCDIYESKFSDGKWSEPKNLGTNINQPNSWESQPTISADGKTLIFSSIREGGLGGTDLYKSEKSASGDWSKAENLGPVINTAGNDKSPFLHSDSQTLYFSSDGHPGVGGYDIFFSKFGDNKQWAAPKNIGSPINSEADDLAFFVSTNGKLGYFSSNKLNGKGGWDLYSFELYKEARPEKVLFMKGTVTDDKNQEVKNARIELKNIDTKEITHIPVDGESGKYVAVVNFKSDYIMTVKKEGMAFSSEYFSKEDTTLDKPATVNVNVKPIEVGAAYKLNNINFETKSYQLSEIAINVIEELVAFLNENKKVKIAIHGHTDNVGGAQDNLELSENRAKAVYQYLMIEGIDKTRLSHKGFGQTKPLTTNDTEAGRFKNRRIEFFVVAK